MLSALFHPVSFEGSSHGGFSSNNDTGRACRKEDLRGIYSLVLHECGFQQYCCVAPAVSSSLVWYRGSQPFCSIIVGEAPHSVLKTGCQTRPVGFESKILRIMRFIPNFLVVLVLERGARGAAAVRGPVARLGLNVKNGKISKASPKKHAVIHTAFVLSGVTNAHTLNRVRVILRTNLLNKYQWDAKLCAQDQWLIQKAPLTSAVIYFNREIFKPPAFCFLHPLYP